MKKTRVRKILAALTAAAAVLLGVTGVMAGTMQICVSDMNFRTGGSTSAKKIGLIPSGSVVELLESSNGWDRVAYNSQVGWIHGGNLSDISGTTMRVTVVTGYLALRNARAYDSSNEIGKLYTGDTVKVQNTDGKTYWYVYAPSLGKSGYVNKNYLVYANAGTSGEQRTVSVASGYLALRTGKAYDSANEIGELYTGDVVYLQDTSDSTYWYVYSSKLGKYGFVNKNYLSGNNPPSAETRTVSVASGYLALRTAMAYDSSNEIGALYNGETVQVKEKTSSNYWYVYAPSLGKSGYVNCNYLV